MNAATADRRIPRLVLGVLLGLAAGVVDVLLMLPMKFREKPSALAGAFFMRAVLAAGASHQQIEDALAVCFSFNLIGRLANAFGFFVPGPKAFEDSAKYLLARG